MFIVPIVMRPWLMSIASPSAFAVLMSMMASSETSRCVAMENAAVAPTVPAPMILILECLLIVYCYLLKT